MPSIRFDESFSTVAVCSCGWRVQSNSRPGAMMTASRHFAEVHNDAARAASLKYRATLKTADIQAIR